MTMTIGVLAERGDVNVQTIRYYERRGILRPTARTAAGYRQYDAESIDRLRFIRQAQELGFSLDEIGELLALRVADPAACAVVEARTRAKLEDVNRKIGELTRMKRVLERLTAACEAREPTAECPILETLVAPTDG
jgi:Hg(II)-responsive transcriptional regulator